MTLVLEFEHLLGVAFAARSQASDVPDWPPQPDRAYSALVATWAARGERIEERRALEWLEEQPIPEVAASGGFARTAPTVFVPPNDPETGRIGDRSVMPALRRRQPRRFPAFRPDNPVARLVWRGLSPNDTTVAALNALAADTSYLGHSACLVRCLFRTEQQLDVGERPRRTIYPGRLAELERAHHAERRPNPGESVTALRTSQITGSASVFSDRWLVFEHVGGEMPDLRAAALVARRLHKAVMAGYERIGLGGAIPAVVSGHSPDGAPLGQPHLGAAPMAFLGSRHADGTAFGFALIPPRSRDLLSDTTFQRAVREIMPWKEATGRPELTLESDGFHLVFALLGESPRRSLGTAPYIAEAMTWATCTPAVLDRHLKETGNEVRQVEMENLLRRACANIGLPEPERVVAGKHSAVQGAPSAYPLGRAPHWTGWRLPQSLASRQLTHAVLQFRHPVRGPVILGAGRYVGLGLCRALDQTEREA
jgi:CRISPR-associated protein Csb2